MNIVIPDERCGERLMPTIDEQQMIDAYTEGASAERAGEWFGWSKMQVHRLLDRYQVPLREGYYPGNSPRYLDDAAILAGGNESLDWHIRRLALLNAADLANGGSCFPASVVRRAA